MFLCNVQKEMAKYPLLSLATEIKPPLFGAHFLHIVSLLILSYEFKIGTKNTFIIGSKGCPRKNVYF